MLTFFVFRLRNIVTSNFVVQLLHLLRVKGLYFFSSFSKSKENTDDIYSEYYALINRTRGSYEETFVLTLKAYGPNEVKSMRLEHHNKYFPYGLKFRLIRALLYTYRNKRASDEILLS